MENLIKQIRDRASGRGQSTEFSFENFFHEVLELCKNHEERSKEYYYVVPITKYGYIRFDSIIEAEKHISDFDLVGKTFLLNQELFNQYKKELK